jgi:hypothetical protein
MEPLEQTSLLAKDEAQRSLGTAYALWLFLGLFGAHRFYLRRYWSAVGFMLTFGGLGLFWIVDGLTLWWMAKRVTVTVRKQRDCRMCLGVIFGVPVIAVAVAAVLTLWALPLTSVSIQSPAVLRSADGQVQATVQAVLSPDYGFLSPFFFHISWSFSDNTTTGYRWVL